MIARGDDWGERGVVPPDAVVCADDAAAAEVVAGARRASHAIPPVVLTGGDLHRTLGGRAGRVAEPGSEATFAPCDIGEVLLDGKLHWFVAQLTVGGPWWAASTIVVANAAHLGRWNVAPRAHPGDGHLDVVEAQLAWRDRFLSLRRLPSGSHVPHPSIRVSRCDHRTFDLDRPRRVRLDGRASGRHRRVVVRVGDEPLRVYVV